MILLHRIITFVLVSLFAINPVFSKHHSAEPSSMAVELLKETYSSFDNVDYYTDKELVVPFPGISTGIAFSWGYGGAGDLFEPFKEVKARKVTTAKKAKALVDEQNEDDTLMAALGKALLKDKASGFVKAQHDFENLPIFTALLKMRLTPELLFGVKLALLLRTEQDFTRLRDESLRLIFRLALTKKPLHKDIWTVMPQELVEYCDQISPAIKPMVSDMWAAITSNDTFDLAAMRTSCVSIEGLVFRDAELAEQCFAASEGYDGPAFITDVLEKSRAFRLDQVTSYEEFARFGKGKPNPFTKNLIGSKSFNMVTGKDQVHAFFDRGVCSELYEQIENVGVLPATILFHNVDANEHWVLYVSQRLSAQDALKCSALACVQAFKKFAKVQATLLNSGDATSKAYREQLETRKQEAEKLREKQHAERTALVEKMTVLQNNVAEQEALTKKWKTRYKALSDGRNEMSEIYKAHKATLEQLQLEKKQAQDKLDQLYLNDGTGLLTTFLSGLPECDAIKTELFELIGFIVKNSTLLEEYPEASQVIIKRYVPELLTFLA